MIRLFLFLGQTDIDCGDQEFQAEAKQLPPATSVPRPLGKHQQTLFYSNSYLYYYVNDVGLVF